MTGLRTEVLVIGGGATGAGVAWDAALRGYDVVLVERRDLGEGTSGRFHGLLHSGGRYAVKDPDAARECIEENVVARRILPDAIEDTGGLFVTTPDDDRPYGARFLPGCAAPGVPAAEIPVARALAREPRLNPGIKRAFTVPDASNDAWKTVFALARGIAEHGGRVLTYHSVLALRRDGDEVTGARVRNELTGEELDVEAGFTINASGAWAAEIAGMAAIEGVHVAPGKGIMIAMNHRLVHTVVNRCTMPADGDILVPIRTVSVIGTTDIHTADPDDLPVTQAEVEQMLDDGERLVPGFREARALRVWAGVRPLFQDQKAGEAVTAMCRQLGTDRPCRTRVERLPGSESGEYYHLGARLRARERSLQEQQVICECEFIERDRLEETMRRRGTANLDDIRRSLRLGMGPCQGGFCIYRATGILHGVGRLDGREASASLHSFLQERWKGMWPILYGDQLRQARLDDWIFQGLLDVEHLPPDGAPAPQTADEQPALA